MVISMYRSERPDVETGTAESSHIVQFYEDEGFLSEKLVSFTLNGLAANESLVVVATEPRRRILGDRLRSRGNDVQGAGIEGQLVLLDVEEVLSKFMVGAMPDWDLFRAYIGGLIEQASERTGGNEAPPIRIYAEMVDVLSHRGNSEGAIRLEEHFNNLGKTHHFSLLCAYAMGNFHKQAHAESFRRICTAHGRVHPTESYSSGADPESRLRDVAMLQQRACALETEIEQRQALEAALRDALRERELSERAAQDADRRKDEFLAMLGHELRNPLAPILTALQLMQLRGAGGDREQKVIERQVRHLGRLVDDLLDVSRITRGKVQLKTEPVELAVVIAKAIEMASPIFEQRSHTLAVDVPREGLMLEADQVRLGQVLFNLLTNAAKYTDPGGRIAVKGWRDENSVAISVQDNGAGISKEMLPNVFELFVQGQRTIDRSQGGLGIGLTLARSLVELHGGSIAARSDGLGKGTEFVVHLPTAAKSAEREMQPRKPQKLEIVRMPRVRVLLVDDNVDAAEVLAEALRSFGHDVKVAHDGPEALSVAPRFQPDTAILDIGLPVMDGYELATKLREQMPTRRLRLLALTGYGQDSDKAKSLAAGFNVHLVKPVNLSTILEFLDDKPHGTRTPTTRPKLKASGTSGTKKIS